MQASVVTSDEAKGRNGAVVDDDESDGEDELGDRELDEEAISNGKV